MMTLQVRINGRICRGGGCRFDDATQAPAMSVAARHMNEPCFDTVTAVRVSAAKNNEPRFAAGLVRVLGVSALSMHPFPGSSYSKRGDLRQGRGRPAAFAGHELRDAR